jgi:hypothetical protein
MDTGTFVPGTRAMFMALLVNGPRDAGAAQEEPEGIVHGAADIFIVFLRREDVSEFQ